MPSAGLPAGAVNPTGLDPRTPPRRRGPRQGWRGTESNGVERHPIGLGLDGVASGGRVVEMPGGDRTPQEDATSSDAEGGVMRSDVALRAPCARDRNHSWL